MLVKTDGLPVEIFKEAGTGFDDFVGSGFIYEAESHYEECDIHKTVFENRLFVDALIVICAVFGCLLCSACVSSCSYSSMSRNYERLVKYRES